MCNPIRTFTPCCDKLRLGGKVRLGLPGGEDGSRGGGEGEEAAVPFGVDLLTVESGEGPAENGAVCFQELSECTRRLLQQPGRAFDVGEYEGDHALRESGLWHYGDATGGVVLMLGVYCPVEGSTGVLGHVDEAGVLLEEGQLDEAGWAVAVLGHDDLGDTPFGRLGLVHLRPVQEHDDVRILF